ncbi:response regulator transcription factor [Micromonospora sp. NPDC051196]|uniref:response regulator transcription factor n=1 Tax=Micromonospora sp. NPDC051196 TaxID=3155281 RepID=UPI003418D853
MTALPDLIAALRSAGLDTTAVDIAETLWLAQIIDAPVSFVARTRSDASHHPPPPTDAVLSMPVTATPPPADPGAELHPSTADDHLASGAPNTLALRSPGVPALPHALALGRALRPLRRYVPSSRVFDLDEEETANRIAHERLWIPMFRPRPELEADLALIVDSSPSMAVWQPTLRELLLLMQRIGAFRIIRDYCLDSDRDGELALLPRGSRVASAIDPDSVTDPTRRRIIIVVTDGVGAAWHDGRMDIQLQRWARVNRLQVLCVLPRRMWNATGLRTRTATSDRPAHREARAPVPVLELSLPAIRRRGPKIGRAQGAATLLPPDDTGTRQPDATGPAELLRRFLNVASPTAQRLAGYLAAAPLTLPTMRLVQQVMLPDSAPTHLAEVYLSGLIYQPTPAGPDDDIDTVQFEFRPGVRELLLDSTDRAEAVRVLTLMSTYVTDRFGRQILDFPALLRAPETAEVPELTSGTLPIARIAAPVLRGLGPRFAGLADRLEAKTHSSGGARTVVEQRAGEAPEAPPARMVLSIDIVGYAAGNASQQRAVFRLLNRMVDAALREMGVEFDDTERHMVGDGWLVVLPPHTEQAPALAALLHSMAEHLHLDRHRYAEQLRLRVGASASSFVRSASGNALVEAVRLCNCAQVRQVMADRPDLLLVAAVSDQLYTEVVRAAGTLPVRQGNMAVLDPRAFRRIDVATKGYQGVAWLWTDAAGAAEPSSTTVAPAAMTPPSADIDLLSTLTAREREVLAALAEGLTNRELGQRLFMSERTVGVHVSHIFDKLQVRTRVQATAIYLRHEQQATSEMLPALTVAPPERGPVATASRRAQFVAALAELYRAAGSPPMRRITARIRARHDKPGRIAIATVYALLYGRTLADWSTVNAVVRVLASMAKHPYRNPEEEAARLHDLWLVAIDPSELPTEAAGQGSSSTVQHLDTLAAPTSSTTDPDLLDEVLTLPNVHLVIDGHHVVGSGSGSGSGEMVRQRNQLIADLGKLATRTDTEVSVVFDMAESTGPLPASPRGVRILFPRRGDATGELIGRLVRAEPADRRVVTISSERETADGERRPNTYSYSPDALLRLLAHYASEDSG